MANFPPKTTFLLFYLDAVLLPDSGYYHYFLGTHDTAGVFSSAVLVAWSNSSGDTCVINKIDVGTPTFSAELFNIEGQLITTVQFSGSCSQCQLNNIPLPKGLYGILFRNQTMQRFVKVMVF